MTDRIRFYEFNLIGESTLSVSSEDALYPKENLYNEHRTKAWRPSGRFTIDATNNQLYIDDGTEQTLTLTNGEYATPGALAAEIDSKLSAVSVNHTCNYVNDKFVFATIGTLTLKTSIRTQSIWDDIGFIGEVDLVLGASGTSGDEIRIHTSERITVDAGVAAEATLAAIVSDVEEIFPLTDEAVVKLQANNVEDWSSPPLDITMSVSDRGAFAHVAEGSYYRYWSIEIVDRKNPLGADGLFFGVGYIGSHSTLEATNIARGFGKKLVDKSSVLTSESGQKYVDIRQQYDTFTAMTVQLAAQADRQVIEDIYAEYGIHKPLFVSFDPGLCLSTDEYDFTRYVRFASDPTEQHRFLPHFDIKLSFEESL